METILDFFGMSKLKSTKRGDDDRVDRLSRNVSVTMLVFFSIVVTTKTFVGEPIHCWVPPRFSGSQEDYINSYCWIRNTYFLDHHKDVPTEDDETPKEEITYYQWVPLILLVQALFFYMPYMLWKSCSNKTGLDLNSIVMAGESFNATETAEVRDKTMGYMTTQMDRYLAESRKDFRKSRTISFKQILACCTCLRGTCLYGFYMFIKVLFLLNVLLQFLAINYIFGNGLEIIKSSVNETGHVMGSRHFPRATMCDFKVRRLGNNHRTTVQCVLPINHFNEKIFILLWFWFLVVMVITCFSMLTWLVRMFPRSRLDGYAQRHLDYALAAANEMEDENDRSVRKKQVKAFVDYLDRDGIFVMRMLALNADTITATDFLYALFENFRNKKLIFNVPGSSDDKMADKMEDTTYKRRAKLLKKK